VHVQVVTVPVWSFDGVAGWWRALEAEAGALSLFQSWTWVGCLAEERYDDPVLLRAEADGRTIGLALFNRRRGRLHLAESGQPSLDSPFIEHNGPLVAADAAPDTLTRLFATAWRDRRVRGLVLGGVPPAILAAANGVTYRLREETAPFVDLARIRAEGGDWLGTLSANTRYQIRRSLRFYMSRGPLRVDRAGTLDEALAWFEALVRLHGEQWRRRGEAGAFADPFALRFHRSLIERAHARGELELLRLTAGGDVLGYLYNFRLGGRVFAYQSGLDHAEAGRHGKPGLTFHALAVQRALAEGAEVYDFLAGAARYKLSLSNASTPLVWAETVCAASMPGMLARMRSMLQRATGFRR
jgi:CelD/BcsL family acetyltransferase involved in cellulose biosynthesis